MRAFPITPGSRGRGQVAFAVGRSIFERLPRRPFGDLRFAPAGNRMVR